MSGIQTFDCRRHPRTHPPLTQPAARPNATGVRGDIPSKRIRDWYRSQTQSPSPPSDSIIWQRPSGAEPIGQTRPLRGYQPSPVPPLCASKWKAVPHLCHCWRCMMSLHKDSRKLRWGSLLGQLWAIYSKMCMLPVRLDVLCFHTPWCSFNVEYTQWLSESRDEGSGGSVIWLVPRWPFVLDMYLPREYMVYFTF